MYNFRQSTEIYLERITEGVFVLAKAIGSETRCDGTFIELTP